MGSSLMEDTDQVFGFHLKFVTGINFGAPNLNLSNLRRCSAPPGTKVCPRLRSILVPRAIRVRRLVEKAQDIHAHFHDAY